MITVHHLEKSRSHRILWLLEELEVPYEIKKYARDPSTSLAPAELTAIHPLGKSPILVDVVEGEATRTIVESGAIIEYVIDRYGKGRLIPPAGSDEHIRYTFWIHYAEGSVMPLMLMKLVLDRVEKAPMPFFVRPIAKQITKTVKGAFVNPQLALHLGYIESELAKHTWFAGDEFTAADIQMSFPVEGAAARGGAGDTRPKMSAFLERIHARPAYKRAIERGGEFSMLT